MFDLSVSQGRPSEDSWTSIAAIYTTLKVEEEDYGFRDGTSYESKGSNFIWVIVDLLTKSAHFIPLELVYKDSST